MGTNESFMSTMEINLEILQVRKLFFKLTFWQVSRALNEVCALYPPVKEKVHFSAPNSVKNLVIHRIRWQIQHWFVHRIQWPQIKCQKKHIFQWLFYHWIRWWFIGDYLLVTSWSNGCLSWSLSVACSFNVSKPSDLYWSHLSDFIFCFDLYH